MWRQDCVGRPWDKRLEAEHRCTGQGGWDELNVGQSHLETTSVRAHSPDFSVRGRLLEIREVVRAGIPVEACIICLASMRILPPRRDLFLVAQGDHGKCLLWQT